MLVAVTLTEQPFHLLYSRPEPTSQILYQHYIMFMETTELNPGVLKTDKCHQDREQVDGRYLGSSKRFLPVSLALHNPNTPNRMTEVTEL